MALQSAPATSQLLNSLDQTWAQGGDIASGIRNLANLPNLSPNWSTGLYVASKYVEDAQKKVDKFHKSIKAIIAFIILLLVAVIITTGISAGRVNHFVKNYDNKYGTNSTLIYPPVPLRDGNKNETSQANESEM